jgi:Protein of unknown function (DUF3617)
MAVFFSAILAAQPPALNVKMGLWEITSASKIGGELPAIDTTKMTPEQKARSEAARQKMMEGRSRIAQTCMTKEKFEKSNFVDARDVPGSTCKKTVTTNTGSTLDANEVCTGEHIRTMHVHIDAQSSESWKGNTQMSITESGKTTTVSVALTAKWLGADCGTRK